MFMVMKEHVSVIYGCVFNSFWVTMEVCGTKNKLKLCIHKQIIVKFLFMGFVDNNKNTENHQTQPKSLLSHWVIKDTDSRYFYHHSPATVISPPSVPSSLLSAQPLRACTSVVAVTNHCATHKRA